MSLELTIAVCDEEEYYRERIKEIICHCLDREHVLYHIQLFEDGEEFCGEDINYQKFDAVFLNVGMKRRNGMDIAYEIRKHSEKIDIAFIAGTSEYVFEGYKVSAVRYMMKNEIDVLLPECIRAILKRKGLDGRRMEFPFVGGTREIELKDLLYVESRSHRLKFVRNGENLYMYGQIGKVEEKLPHVQFVRCHQSFLANLKHIVKIRNYLIYLSNGSEIPISRPKYSDVRRCFLRYKES